jgi:hypothetical protein
VIVIQIATVEWERNALAADMDRQHADDQLARVNALLPANYFAFGFTPDGYQLPRIIIAGADDEGWTYNAYVEPRLYSGNVYARHIIGIDTSDATQPMR